MHFFIAAPSRADASRPGQRRSGGYVGRFLRNSPGQSIRHRRRDRVA
ncbi:MAG: hypothetical protein MZV64_00505 [Ignavibacteriales bacterium]|nr:hypothetical protein [Ignavibacteriales bacterium]